jgi:hypothetical protein
MGYQAEDRLLIIFRKIHRFREAKDASTVFSLLVHLTRIQSDTSQPKHQSIANRSVFDPVDRITERRKCPQIPLREEFGNGSKTARSGPPLVTSWHRIAINIHHFV